MDWSTCSVKTAAALGGITVPTLGCIFVLIGTIINWALSFAGVVAIFFIIVAGYKYIISHGDPKKIEEARKTLVYAILGLAIIFLSFFIVNIIIGISVGNPTGGGGGGRLRPL